MSQSAARLARRHGHPGPKDGLGGEMVADAIEESQRTLRNSRGVQPATIINIEQVQLVGGGHQVLLTIDTPHGPQAFAIPADQARPAGQRMHELAGDAARGLFVIGDAS